MLKLPGKYPEIPYLNEQLDNEAKKINIKKVIEIILIKLNNLQINIY